MVRYPVLPALISQFNGHHVKGKRRTDGGRKPTLPLTKKRLISVVLWLLLLLFALCGPVPFNRSGVVVEKGDWRQKALLLCKLRRGRVAIKSVGTYCGPQGSQTNLL